MRKNNENITQTIAYVLRLLTFLSPASRRRLRGLVFFMFIGAIAEIANIGALLPFLAILASPADALVNPRLGFVTGPLGLDSANDLVLVTSISFIVVVLLSSAIRVALLRFTTRTIFDAGHEISVRAYSTTLLQPYSVHIGRNTSEVVSALTVKIGSIMFDFLFPWSILLNALIVIVFIVLALFAISPVVSLLVGAAFAAIYVLVVGLSHRQLHANGIVVAQEQTRSVKILQEGLGGIRDVIIDRLQDVYVGDFTRSDRRLRAAQANNLFLGGSPRYIVEALGISIIAGLAFVLSNNGGLVAALPILGALALGAQRLLPAFNQAQNSWSLIVGNQSVLRDMLDILDQPVEHAAIGANLALTYEDKIVFSGARYTYPGASRPSLVVDNASIRRGSKVGIIGATGGGKSTFLDVTMGLLFIDEGTITVDGIKLGPRNAWMWQAKLAHVPQHIYLIDGSMRSNIALGVGPDKIDESRLVAAVEAAQLSEFVSSLPGGLGTEVGEQGVRLSGGQRQRIGIARALYKRSEVLILDEATSALDYETERAVMDAIGTYSKDLTVIIVAHRPNTLANCDEVYSVDGGLVMRLIDK